MNYTKKNPEAHRIILFNLRAWLDKKYFNQASSLVYLISEIKGVSDAILIANFACEYAENVEPIVIALADLYHRQGDYGKALWLIERQLKIDVSDALIIKFCDFTRDLGKGFRGEMLLREHIRSGRDALIERLAEYYFEGKNWSALRNLFIQYPQTDISPYRTYLLGRANVSLLLEPEVIDCADRLWAMEWPGPRYAQLLMDVWRWRIGNVEDSRPTQDGHDLPYWLSVDADAIQKAPYFSNNRDSLVRSDCGWRSIRPRENLPNVLAIGTQRSATTWLWHHLSNRPEVQLLPLKETDFFSDAFSTPLSDHFDLSQQDDLEVNFYYRDGPTRNLFRYLRLYGAGQTIRPDFSPSYVELPDETIAVIRDLLGSDTKILLSVRDPVERSWSNLQYDMKLVGINPHDLTFDERISHYVSDISIRRSDYGAILNRWSKYFSNIKVVFFDDIKIRPKQLIHETFEFIGIQSNSVCRITNEDYCNRINTSLDMEIPIQDRTFLLGLHHKNYDDSEQVLGGPALEWRLRHIKAASRHG